MIARPANPGLFATLLEWCAAASVSHVPPEAPDRDRAHRDFILDRMEACPEAFQSESDLHAMMHCFPGRF